MEAMPNPNQPFCDTTVKIARRFASEARRMYPVTPDALPPPVDRKPTDLNDFKIAIQEMTLVDPERLLTDEMLQARIDYMMQDSKLKLHFPAGAKCFPAIVPFSNLGHPLTPQEIQNGLYLDTFIVDESGKTINGFGSGDSYAGDFLPQEIQDTAFVIGKYKTDDLFNVTPTDRAKLAQQYTEAFKKLRELF